MNLEEGMDSHGNPLLDEEHGHGGGPPKMSASMVQAIEDASAIPEMSVNEAKRLNKRQRLWTVLVCVVAVAAVAFAIASIAIEASVVAIFAFWAPIVTAPYVIYQRRMLNKLPTLVHVINETRSQVNRLTQQNDLFSKENDRLTLEVADLQQLEFKLKQLCQKSGTNVEELQSLIKENGEIQKQMRKTLDAALLQDIFAIFLKSDANNDFTLSEKELDRLILRLKGYNVVGQQRLKDNLRVWFDKTNAAEWKKLEDEIW